MLQYLTNGRRQKQTMASQKQSLGNLVKEGLSKRTRIKYIDSICQTELMKRKLKEDLEKSRV